MRERFLTDFELMIVLAILRVKAEAYGVPIARGIEETAGRPVTLGAVYMALDRLQENGLVVSRLGDATPQRGGRAKRFFPVTPPGLRAAPHTRPALIPLLEGIPEVEGGVP